MSDLLFPGLVHIFGNWETEHYNSVSEITVSFLGIQTFVMDSHRPFICSVVNVYGCAFLLRDSIANTIVTSPNPRCKGSVQYHIKGFSRKTTVERGVPYTGC